VIRNKRASRNLLIRLAGEHEDETGGDTRQRLPDDENPTICARAVSDMFSEQGDKRTKALKTNFETHIGNRDRFRLQQFLCSADPPVGQILVRRFFEGLTKQPMKVIRRNARFARDLIERQREVVTVVYELACPTKPLVDVFIHGEANSRSHTTRRTIHG